MIAGQLTDLAGVHSHGQNGFAIPSKLQGTWSKHRMQVENFIVTHWLPITFAVAITFALSWPAPGKAVVHVVVLRNVHIIQEINIGIVFFLSGLALRTSDLTKARGRLQGMIYAFLAILFITPMYGFVMRGVPLQPRMFSIGLCIYCAMPTTLGAGVALVRSCKGNDGMALLMTIGTNMIAVGTIPFMLKLLFLNYNLEGLSIKVDLLNLFIKLSITILAPSVLGKVVRELWKPAENFANQYRTALSMFSTFNLAFIMWQTLSGARDRLLDADASMVVAVLGLSASTYLFYLLFNFILVCYVFRMPVPDAISVIIMSSQKSAPVAVTVISYISSDPATQGIMAIPAIVGQLVQIFLGSAMAPFIARTADAYNENQQQHAEELQADKPPDTVEDVA